MAPVEVAAEPAAPLIHEASKGQRFTTAFIDQVIVRLLTVASVVALPSPEQGGSSVVYLYVAALILMNIGYFVVLEAATGKTFGKMIVGTRVIDLEGKTPALGPILIRTLCRYIPFEPISFFLADRGWHDSLSKTRVVRTRRNVGFR
jgi:uncharacterized RDD family membrane protein YckC